MLQVKCKTVAAVITLGVSSLSFSQAWCSEQSLMVVFDASGSMWENSGNSDRLTVAKDAVDQLLGELPESLDVGMTVYGHRRKGDCTDIQVFPAGSNRNRLRQSLQSITARGKTPLGAAIEKTANKLSQTDTNARIIALTDGLETCGYDLCDLAGTLKQTGVGLTVDVVGFDLEGKDVSSLRCLSEMTGGAYYSAVGFDGLSVAFESITAKSSVATLSEFTTETTGIEHAAKAELDSSLSVKVNAQFPDGKMYMLTVVPAGAPEGEMTTGSSEILQMVEKKELDEKEFRLRLRSRVFTSGPHEVRIVDMFDKRVVLSSDIELFRPGQLSDTEKEEVISQTSNSGTSLGSFVLEAEDRATAGRFLKVSITPTGNSSVIHGYYEVLVVSAGTADGDIPEGSTTTSITIANDVQKQRTVRVPDVPGDYELRLAKRGQSSVMARLPVIVQ